MKASTTIPEFCPASPSEWREWLHANHVLVDAVWVIFYKTSSPKFNMSWSDAVDEALCYGWIDSTKKSLDKERFIQYFCKRKPKSNWSRVNKDKVATLIEQGLMMEAGYKSIEVAKENGSWTILDDVENLIVPPDLELAFSKNEQAYQLYQGLSNSVKKGILYWVNSAKRQNTRDKRIGEVIESGNKGMIPERFR